MVAHNLSRSTWEIKPVLPAPTPPTAYKSYSYLNSRLYIYIALRKIAKLRNGINGKTAKRGTSRPPKVGSFIVWEVGWVGGWCNPEKALSYRIMRATLDCEVTQRCAFNCHLMWPPCVASLQTSPYLDPFSQPPKEARLQQEDQSVATFRSP